MNVNKKNNGGKKVSGKVKKQYRNLKSASLYGK